MTALGASLAAKVACWTLAWNTIATNTLVQAQSPENFVQQRADLSIFSGHLNQLGISPQIAKTLLAPNNNAFLTFQQDNPEVYTRYIDEDVYFVHREMWLNWHLVVDGPLTVTEIFDGTRTKLANPRGNVTVSFLSQSIDGVPRSKFIETDISLSGGNAIAHVLDQVLMPPEFGVDMIPTLLQHRHTKFSFTIMAQLALFVGLEEEVNKVYLGGFTFLVPPNRRFNRYEYNVPGLINPRNKEYTRRFVLGHMIPGNHYEESVFARNAQNGVEEYLVITFLGTHLWVTSTDGILRFQAQPVLLADQLVQNGVFHAIERPLEPPYISNMAEYTYLSTNWNINRFFRLWVSSLMSSGEIAEMFNTTLSGFAPTEEAWKFFNQEDFARLVEPIWVRHMMDLLLNHVSAGAYTREEYFQEAPSLITMLSGVTYPLRRRNGNPRIGSAEMVFGDLITVDGYLHVIDEVLPPPSVTTTIYDFARFSNKTYNGLTLFAENVDFVQAADLVDRDLPITIFVPYNRAFRRVKYSVDDAPDIVRRHVFRGLNYFDVIANKTEMTNVDGLTFGIQRVDNNETGETELWIGDAKIIQSDVFARNGLMHVVDRVFNLEYPSPAPSTSPAPTVTAQPTMYVPPTARPVEGVGPTRAPFTFSFRPVLPPSQGAGTDEILDLTPDEENSSGASISRARWLHTGLFASTLAILLFNV